MTTSQSDLKYVWSLKKDSKLLRYYKWIYTNNTTDSYLNTLTFCKLFWGVVASPVVLIFWGIVTLITRAIDWLPDRKVKGEAAKVAKARKNKSKNSAIPNFLNRVADRIASFFQWIGRGFSWIGRGLDNHPAIDKALGWVVMSLSLLALLAGLAVGFYYWNDLAHESLVLMGIDVAWIVGAIVVGLGLALLIGLFVSPLGRAGGWFYEAILVRIGHFFRAIYRFFAFGFHAIKTRTCPRVEVVD